MKGGYEGQISRSQAAPCSMRNPTGVPASYGLAVAAPIVLQVVGSVVLSASLLALALGLGLLANQNGLADRVHQQRNRGRHQRGDAGWQSNFRDAEKAVAAE